MGKKYKYFLSGGRDRGFAFLGEEVKHPAEADLIVFTGGEDINPALYNESTGKHTNFSRQRDAYEISLYNKFIDTPKLGVCRGHQLLSVLAGASLIQHVTKHNATHKMTTYSGMDMDVTSCHHQMVNLYGLKNMEDYFLIGYADSLSTTYLNGLNTEIAPNYGGQLIHKVVKEPEMVYFPEIKAITVQFHPKHLGLA